ncbi:MAG: hypothetical protein LBT09_09520 [Planctomycetaceae bacterium]|nr:hypothetical protein [Planctomycetaceae bacterium]
MLVETIAIKSTASRRDAMLVRSMIDVYLPTFRPYGTRCFSWTLFSTNILPLTARKRHEIRTILLHAITNHELTLQKG